MNTESMTFPDVLERAGFRPSPAPARNTYCYNGHRLVFEPDWATLFSNAGAPDDDPLSLSSMPGPWKRVRHGSEVIDVADLPLPDLLQPATEGVAEWNQLETTLQWGLATASGAWKDTNWCPPSREDLERCVPPDGLTVRCDERIQHGQIVRECHPPRLAIRFPVLDEIPECLSNQRRAWLRCLLEDVHARCRLVRLTLPDSTRSGPACQAEVDLTGADHALLVNGLFIRALSCLRRVVADVVPVATLIADANAVSEILEVAPSDLFEMPPTKEDSDDGE